DRSLDADAYEHPAPDPALPEMARQLVGPRVQLGVGGLLVSAHQRDGVRCPTGLSLEQVMDALVAGVIGRGLVPFDQDLRALRRVRERQGRGAPGGVS